MARRTSGGGSAESSRRSSVPANFSDIPEAPRDYAELPPTVAPARPAHTSRRETPRTCSKAALASAAIRFRLLRTALRRIGQRGFQQADVDVDSSERLSHAGVQLAAQPLALGFERIRQDRAHGLGVPPARARNRDPLPASESNCARRGAAWTPGAAVRQDRRGSAASGPTSAGSARHAICCSRRTPSPELFCKNPEANLVDPSYFWANS
jgi:hypothetical protein